ncbi:MAG: phage major capsid protein [Cyanobium usitatum Tobar12.5m-G36]|nr:phage major capsid protein [Cyanobium usitatum Tobar12.5m-G36]
MATRSPEPPGRFSLLGLLAGDSYELGLAELAARKYGAVQPRGQALPHNALVRDLGLATATGGGNLAATELAAVAAATRPLLVLDQLGAQRLEVSGVAQLDLPRFDGGVGSWISEGDPASSLSTTVQSASAVARCAAARLGLSRKVRNGSRPDTEAAILAEIQRAVTNTIEQGFIQGTGSNSQPVGIVNVPGIGSKTFISATPTWSELVDMGELLCNADGDFTRAAWLLHPSMAAALLLRLIDGNGGELVVTYSDGRHRIAGIPLAISSNVPETKVILADFSTVQQVFFGAPQIIDDRFSAGKSISGASEIVVMNFCDVVARDPGLIVVGAA